MKVTSLKIMSGSSVYLNFRNFCMNFKNYFPTATIQCETFSRVRLNNLNFFHTFDQINSFMRLEKNEAVDFFLAVMKTR